MSVDAEKNKLQNCYLGFWKFWKCRKFWDFFNIFFIFFFQKISPNFKIFKKRNMCTRRDSKEGMYQVSSNALHKCGFHSAWNVKNGYFSGHLGVIPCISIFSYYSDFYATTDVLRSFFAFWTKNRTINMYYDAKWPKSAIWPRDLRWPWPQKRSPRAKDDAQICHRPESCRFIGCLCVYSRNFARERQ